MFGLLKFLPADRHDLVPLADYFTVRGINHVHHRIFVDVARQECNMSVEKRRVRPITVQTAWGRGNVSAHRCIAWHAFELGRG